MEILIIIFYLAALACWIYFFVKILFALDAIIEIPIAIENLITELRTSKHSSTGVKE